MKFKVFLSFLLLSTASAAPAPQEYFLVPSDVIPADGYIQRQYASLFLPAEHRVDPIAPGQVKPAANANGNNQFAIYSTSVPVGDVPVAVNLQSPGQVFLPGGGAFIPLSGQSQVDSKETPAAVKLAIAVPAVSQATRLTITIDIQPSADAQKDSPQSTPVVGAAAPGSAQAVSVDSAAVPNDDAGITVEAAPIIEVASFPANLASPSVDEDELSNRDPSAALSPVAPGGIVQSGQPNIVSLVFQNSKDSPHLLGMLADAQAQFGTTRQ